MIVYAHKMSLPLNHIYHLNSGDTEKKSVWVKQKEGCCPGLNAFKVKDSFVCLFKQHKNNGSDAAVTDRLLLRRKLMLLWTDVMKNGRPWFLLGV